jgi:hypothetical protein
MPIAFRRSLLVCLCALLSFGAPLSFGATPDMPCESMMSDDNGDQHHCDCDASDQTACMASCSALSSAPSLPISAAAALEPQKSALLADLSIGLQSFTGPPGRRPPK